MKKRFPALVIATLAAGGLASWPVPLHGKARSSSKPRAAAPRRAATPRAVVPLGPALATQVEAAQRVAREVGVEILDLQSGQQVYGLNPDRQMVIASNNKLFTTAAALDALGPGYQFETRLLATGPVAGGTLDGDLAVVGGGDPAISGRNFGGDSYAPFRPWAAALKARGINKVKGHLILVTGFFDAERVHPDWPHDQLVRWYEAPVSALAFNESCVLVRVRPGRRPGEPAQVETEPPIVAEDVRNTARTVASRRGHSVIIGRSADTGAILVSGSIYVGSGPVEAEVAVKDPVGLFDAGLRDALRQEGVEIAGASERAEQMPAGAWEEIATFRSDLQSAIEVTNKHSQNLFAESLFKLLGRVRCGEGSWAGGAKAVGEFLQRVGIPAGSYTLSDGSGLSRNDRFAPGQITTLLGFMYKHRYAREYMQSLPHSGERGLAWQRRLSSPPYVENVFAKTGTLEGVSSLSGYAKARSGKLYAFSILCNGVHRWAHGAQDAIVKALIDNG